MTEPEEILENLQFGLHWLPDAPENSFYSPDHQEYVALPFPELLANVGDEVTPVDVVAERAGQPVPEVVTQLLELELAGWIAAVPGGYVRLRRACHVRRTKCICLKPRIDTEAELRVDQDKLEQDLTDAGFDREDIYNALLWLEKLADYQEVLAEPMQLASDPLSMRIYTPEECERLDASCRGFLLFLEQIQVLNLETREMVIERVLALDNAEFELDDLKWVILMVLFNIPGCENAYQQMEELLFEVNEGMLH